MDKDEFIQGLFKAQSENIGADLMAPYPTPTLRTSEVEYRCGCDARRLFSANLHTLHALNKTAARRGRENYCNRCVEMAPRQRLDKIAGELGVTWEIGDDKGYVAVTCDRGHVTQVHRSNFIRGWHCRSCPKEQRGEVLFREILAERGYRLTWYDSSGIAHKVETPIGEEAHVNGFAFKNRPDADRVKLEGLTPTFNVYLYLDGDLGFYHLGELPRLLPRALWDHIKRAECVVASHHWKIGEARESIADLISRNPSGLRLLNVNHNVKRSHQSPGQWISPGVYTWGTYPSFARTLEVQP